MFATSLLLLHLVFSGLVVALPVALPVFRSPNGHGKIPLVSLLGMSFLAGMLVNLALVLILQSLALSFFAGAAVDLAGVVLLFLWRDEIDGGNGLMPSSGGGWSELKVGRKTMIFLLCVAAAVLLIYHSLLLPIDAWDARSVWFFGAKKIYYAGGLFSDIDRDSLFEHADYPKLIPVMAAQIAQIAGYWNEYLPLSVVAILLCAEFLMLAALIDSIVALLLFFVLLVCAVGISPYLTNGYADMHLAIIAMLACGFFLKAATRRHQADATFGMLLLGLAASIKNEGLVLALIIGFVASVVLVLSARRRAAAIQPDRRDTQETGAAALRGKRGLVFALIVAALPAMLWKFRLWQWNISNDLTATSGWAARFMDRLNFTDIGAILRAIHAAPMLLLALLTWIVVIRLKGRRQIALFLPIVCSVLYLAVLLLVYMTTPSDLAWHLGTSAERVAFPIKLMLIYGATLYLNVIFKYLAYRWHWRA
jgi:hypothetical protein